MHNGQRYFSEGTWHFDLVGKNIWKISYRGAANITYITMDGTAITTELHIPFAHRWNSTHFRHTDNTNTESTAGLNFTIRRAAGKNQPAQFEEDMLYLFVFTGSKRSDLWGEMFEREASTYDIIFETTTAHRVYPVFYVQKLGEY